MNRAARDPRMVSGPAISATIFFDVRDLREAAGGVLEARLRAHPVHEIWLESTGGQLAELAGVLAIHAVAAPSTPPAHRLTRGAEGTYKVALHYPEPDFAPLAAALRASAAQLNLMIEIDGEYDQGYESPGGYSAAYGIRYWDDVLYPDVVIDDRVMFSCSPDWYQGWLNYAD